MARHEQSNDEWQRIETHLPPRKAGAERKDDRTVISGILWKLATGAPWRRCRAMSPPEISAVPLAASNAKSKRQKQL